MNEFWSLAVAVATISWIVTREDVFAPLRRFVQVRASTPKSPWSWFSQLLGCYYCFSVWASVGLLLWTGYRLPTGLIATEFAVVGTAWLLVTIFYHLRVSVANLLNGRQPKTT